MAENSAIEWTDATWNPTTGCTRVSDGCRNCYAFQLHDMRHEAHKAGKSVPAQYAKPFKELQMFEDRLTAPLSWRKPRRIFVNSMSDLFHKDVPEVFIDRVFAAMALAEWHTYQILTKRPERMAEYFSRAEYRTGRIAAAVEGFAAVLPWKKQRRVGDMAVTSPAGVYEGLMGGWRSPLPKNVWLGTSVENQDAADKRIPHLLSVPAAVRFLSCEPLLGEVNLRRYFHHSYRCPAYVPPPRPVSYAGQGEGCTCPRLHWVIVGGESGPGARPCRVEWIRSIVDQCRAASVPVFAKQLGGNIVTRNDMIEDAFNGKDGWPDPHVEHNIHGFREDHQGADCRVRLVDKKGGDPAEWPADLRVRQFPEAKGTVPA
ncbi:MAG: phage Gp37/Gp68 family protein [Gemmataceae bacterium]